MFSKAQMTLCLTSLAALCTGCATTSDRGSSAWLKLPSPWSTVKQSDKGAEAAEAKKQDARKVASKATPAPNSPANKAKHGKDEESASMAILRGRNYERAGDWDKARQVYEELREKHPDNAEVTYRLAIVADAQRRHSEAEQLFLTALQHEPRNAAILADLGYCYYLQGQLAKAESTLLKATLLDPSNNRYSNNLGLVVGHQGRHTEALEYFRKSGSEADAQYNLAFVYAGQDDAENAKSCFQSALAADPTHRRAREALSSFEEFDRMPEYLRDLDSFTDNGVKYVPYIEGGNPTTNNDALMPASAQASVASGMSASKATRTQHAESRGMLSRNMASQRADEGLGK